ncbi:MAG: MarR family transcriptional regulator [Alphaproteobacteria bacterium]|nr:MarR family transcriptional regulator [Alphaproteobacteria bacterium]
MSQDLMIKKSVFPSQPKEKVDFKEFENVAGLMMQLTQLKVSKSFHDIFKGEELNVGRFTILCTINDNPGVNQGVLAKSLEIKRSNMTTLIRSFESKGLLERIVPEDNRRSIELVLTKKGIQIVKEYRPRVLQAEKQVFSMLTEGEYANFVNILHKIMERK